MYSDNIVSLCYISSQNDKTTQLCRIADYHNGGFEAYTYDSTYDFRGTERDLLYGHTRDFSGGVGTIAVFDWSAYQDSMTNEWRTSTRESEVSWVEVISSFKDTPEQLVEMIKSGIKLSMSASKRHDIIVCCRAKGAFADAIYVPANDLVSANDLFTFSEEVISLQTAKINYYSDTASCRCRYNPSDTIRYLIRPGSWKPTGKVSVRTPQEIVFSAVIAYARRLDKDGVITRKERQSFASVIDKLSVASITEEVMEKLGCKRDDAEYYVEECLDDLSERMKRNEADWVMRQLIENNSEYEQEMYEKVEELWHQAHATARAELAAELKKAQDELAAVQQETIAAQNELRAAKARKEQCEADATEAMQLQEDIEKRIQERLALIREDRAKALVDETWAMAAFPSATTVESKPNGTWSFAYDGNTEPIEEVSWRDRWYDAVSSWEHVCGSEQRGSELAAFFFASYALKQHLIISGECAEQLADMASQIVSGRDCVKVYVADHATVTDVIKEINSVPHDCICFLNGLEQNHNVVKDIMRHFGDSHFIITTPYCESLTMEPAGLFTTFLPVCSEEFCVSTSTLDIDTFCCKTDLRKIQHNVTDVRKLRSIRANQASWFANGFFAPMLVERCARLQYEMKSMLATTFSDGEKDSKAAMLNLVFVPLMRCLHRKDVLAAQIAEFDILDETRKKRLLAFAGVEKE